MLRRCVWAFLARGVVLAVQERSSERGVPRTSCSGTDGQPLKASAAKIKPAISCFAWLCCDDS